MLLLRCDDSLRCKLLIRDLVSGRAKLLVENLEHLLLRRRHLLRWQRHLLVRWRRCLCGVQGDLSVRIVVGRYVGEGRGRLVSLVVLVVRSI